MNLVSYAICEKCVNVLYYVVDSTLSDLGQEDVVSVGFDGEIDDVHCEIYGGAICFSFLDHVFLIFEAKKILMMY